MSLTIAQQEALYDAQRTGAAWLKEDDRITLAREVDRLLEDEHAVAAWIDRNLAVEQAAKPASLLLALADLIDDENQLQITRHTHHTDGSPASDPWTTYALGEAEIDIQDAGSVSLYIGQGSIAIDENAQLLDLAMLLANETVLEALDPTKEDTDGIIAILEECDGGESERKALDLRFDNVISAVFELPDAQRRIAISIWEGFVAGVAIGEACK